MARAALVEELTGVHGHRQLFGVAALWTGENRLQLHQGLTYGGRGVSEVIPVALGTRREWG